MSVVERFCSTIVWSDKVVKDNSEIQMFASAQIKISRGTSLVMALVVAERFSIGISSWFEAGVKIKACSDTVLFEPRFCINDVSKIHDAPCFCIPTPKSLHHCALRLRPFGAS